MFIIKEGTPTDKIGEGTENETKEKIAQWLESQGYTVRTSEQDTSFIKSAVQKEVDQVYSSSLRHVDDAILKHTGIQKEGNEKTTDYATRAIPLKFDNLNGSIQDLNKKIEDYEAKGVDGNTKAQEYKLELEALRQQFEKANTDFEEAIKAKDQSIFDNDVKTKVKETIRVFRPRLTTGVDESLLEDILENRINRFYTENKAHSFDNTVVWKDLNGETKLSKKDGKPMSTEEVLLPYFEDLFDKGRRQPGAGSGKDDPGGKGGEGVIHIPGTVKNKTQLYDYLHKDDNGPKFAQGSAEFAKAFDELRKDMPLR